MFAQCLKKIGVSLPLMLAVVFAAGTVSPTTGQTVPKAKAKAKALLDLNKATAEEMEATLPGVGAATAKKIVAGRPYTSVDDLSRAGVPARTIDGLRSMVTVTPPAPAAAKAKAVAKGKEEPAAKGGTPAKQKTAVPPTPSAGKINVNSATAEQLQTLPGIGPVHARAIIAARPFKSVDDLERVSGLGKARVDAIRNQVTVTTPPTVAGTPSVKSGTKPLAQVPGRSTAPTTKPGQSTVARLVNINTASKEQLDVLPGIGPVRAQAILDHRARSPFKTKEDIMKVKGIKGGEFSKIKDLITVD